ncbi:MFS transporter [Tomitella biformata]|uniref:MFS transporter n=1 Tax=Tomitella biformata TaxID=630403 RepID=UPI000463D559|nr:MFS transporter [Tomitella biformata]
MTTTLTTPAPVPTKRSRTMLITAVLCLTGTAVALLQTVVVPLIPEFPAIFGVSADDSSWLITITLLTAAVGTPIIARLADMFGKRRMMVVALVAMIAGSLVAAIGQNFTAVVIGRGLQGLSIALVPVGISILRDELPKARVAAATSLMSATLGIGSALALPLSGFIDVHMGWQGIFWLPAAVGVVMLVAVLLVVPESEVRTPGRFDFVGAILLTIGLSTLLLGITKGGAWGWSSEPLLLTFLVTIVVFALWVPYELRVGSPLVDLRTSARRPVLLTNIASILVGFAMYANMLLTTQQLQMPLASGYGFAMTVFAAGIAMVPAGLAMVFFSPLSALITNRLGAKTTLITGSLIMVVAYVARVYLTGSVVLIIVGATLVSIGTAIAYAAMPMLIMRSVPITETASANGLNSLLRSIGTSTSSAVVAALLTAMIIGGGGAGADLPSLGAFQAAYWIAALAALGAVLVALYIPRQPESSTTALPQRQAPASDGEHSDSEIVVSGIIIGEMARSDKSGAETLWERPIRQAVVSLLSTAGQPVDWSRASNEGRFALVLPQPGRYLVVTSADGWTPHSEVVQFDDATSAHQIRLCKRLTISGSLARGGSPLDAGLVTLTKPTGEFVSSAFSSADGRFELPLPSTGRYILTAMDPTGETVQARQVAVIGASATIDLDLTPADAEMAAL